MWHVRGRTMLERSTPCLQLFNIHTTQQPFPKTKHQTDIVPVCIQDQLFFVRQLFVNPKTVKNLAHLGEFCSQLRARPSLCFTRRFEEPAKQNHSGVIPFHTVLKCVQVQLSTRGKWWTRRNLGICKRWYLFKICVCLMYNSKNVCTAVFLANCQWAAQISWRTMVCSGQSGDQTPFKDPGVTRNLLGIHYKCAKSCRCAQEREAALYGHGSCCDISIRKSSRSA